MFYTIPNSLHHAWDLGERREEEKVKAGDDVIACISVPPPSSDHIFDNK